MLKNMRDNWPLGFLGFMAVRGIQPALQGDWVGALWLVWAAWFIYFLPQD